MSSINDSANDLESDLEKNLVSEFKNDLDEDLESELRKDLESNFKEELEDDFKIELENPLEQDLESDLEKDLDYDFKKELESDFEEELDSNLENALENNLPQKSLKKDSEKLRWVCRIMAITFRIAKEQPAGTISRKWVAKYLNRSEDFVKRNWNRDPFECAMNSRPSEADDSPSQGNVNGLPKEEEENPFKCQICEKSFKKLGSLRIHSKKHKVDIPHKCQYCDKEFPRKGSLLKHEYIHTNTRPFKCSYCPKAFRDQGKRKVHERLHTGERPYKCTICAKGFTESGNLSKHLRVHKKQGHLPPSSKPDTTNENQDGLEPSSSEIPENSEHNSDQYPVELSSLSAYSMDPRVEVEMSNGDVPVIRGSKRKISESPDTGQLSKEPKTKSRSRSKVDPWNKIEMINSFVPALSINTYPNQNDHNWMLPHQ